MRRIGSHGAVGRHRRYRGRRRGPDEAATARARPRARVPRRARARRGRRASAPDRRGRRLELHVPARARRRARSSCAARRGRRCRRRRTTSCARRGCSSRCATAGFARLPTIVAVCEDESLLGVPFYVMDVPRRGRPDRRAAAGARERARAPRARRRPRRRARRDPRRRRERRRRSRHSRDPGATTSARLAGSRSCGRSTRRASSRGWTRSARGSPRHVPEPLPPTVVHGDYRLGNTMVGHGEPTRIVAVLDWEMGAIGDPRADVGYLLATYSEPGGPPNPLGTSPVTALAGFPSRAELVERYVERERPRRRAARLVRGARALEGGRLLRGDLRPLRPRRARCRGHARRALRAGRAVPRRGGSCGDRSTS